MRLLKFFIKTSDVSVKNKQRGAKFCDKNKQRLSNNLKFSKIVKGLLIYGVAYETEKVWINHLILRMLCNKKKDAGALGQAFVSISICLPFRTRFDVHFELNLIKERLLDLY